MMTDTPDLILWNPIARRRRSPSDDFLDNGLAILKAFLAEQGFEVEVIDWARSNQWDKMTPRLLAVINRFLASRLLSSRDSQSKTGRMVSRLVSPLFILTQDLMSAVQKYFQNKMIRELAEYVRDSGCRVVGIKTWYGETYLAAKYFARLVRKLAPEILIVAGGPHPTTYREAVLEDGVFDLAVAGEGERALEGILSLAGRIQSKDKLLNEISRVAGLSSLKNIIYRQNGKVEVSPPENTDANRKVIPVYDNLEGKTWVHVIVDSLGCPWGRCNFCTHSRTYRKYSVRRPESVVDEIEQMVSRGIGIFRFAGSSTRLSHACRIAELIEQRGIRIFFSMFARVESRAAEQHVYEKLVGSYRQLLRSGFRSVFLGAESGNDTVNELVMNKGVMLKDIVATVKAMREASAIEGLPLDIGISLIYPAPTMGKISLGQLKAENIRLVEQVNPDSVLVSPPAPFPGSSWFNDKDRFGFELGESFVRKMLEYDYVLYKPLFLWPEIDMKLEGLSLRKIFEECGSLRKTLEDKGFVTEVTDVQFLMMRNAGYAGKEGVLTFKNQTQLAILSCDYRWIDSLQARVNLASMAQASINKS
ncbi:MAG: B12-binding domain-containing radical SAM protein [Candidatus Glassbacteria bacterium]|nr:B12-binding domain-containing radical SAM protein [Candidatus Glassbacteria bacterium]